MESLWLKEHAGTSGVSAFRLMPAASLSVWESVDGQQDRAYLLAESAPDDTWSRLIRLQLIEGPAARAPPAFHYVVETDVAPAHEADFNAWYEQEHLPGLASVPGTICATRYRRASGSPSYLACYDLLSPAALERPEWLAVRHTAWSARVRPTFQNTRRMMFRRPTNAS